MYGKDAVSWCNSRLLAVWTASYCSGNNRIKTLSAFNLKWQDEWKFATRQNAQPTHPPTEQYDLHYMYVCSSQIGKWAWSWRTERCLGSVPPSPERIHPVNLSPLPSPSTYPKSHIVAASVLGDSKRLVESNYQLLTVFDWSAVGGCDELL